VSERPDGSSDAGSAFPALSPEALADAVGLALVSPPGTDTDGDLVLRLRALLRAALRD
jgi:hypothetical protein